MSDYPKIQITTYPLGKNVTLRGESAEEMAELTSGFAKHADEIVEGITQLEQIFLAKGVAAGTAPTTSQLPSVAPSAPQPVTGSFTPPPPASGAPSCPANGPMKDMSGRLTKAGQPMKYRYYCSKFGCRECEQIQKAAG